MAPSQEVAPPAAAITKDPSTNGNAIHQRQRQRHGRNSPQDQDAGAERADPLLHHPPVGGGAPVARPGDRPGRAHNLQLRDRDPQGEQGQVRAGQEDGAHQGGPRALLLRRLPAQLRLHPAHPLRRLRPHRRPRHHAGARRPGVLPPRQGHRTHAHDRPGRGRRQDHRRLRRRPRVPPLQRHQGAPAPPPRRDQALLRGLQEEREQGGGRQRLPAVRGRLRGHPALHGSLCHLHLRGPEKVDNRSGDAMPLAGGC
uniref:Uncharacterized protein n=1 Tax=Triticum urartu TaxID=4572 RepID=A0A8R7U368_TRIUA